MPLFKHQKTMIVMPIGNRSLIGWTSGSVVAKVSEMCVAAGLNIPRNVIQRPSEVVCEWSDFSITAFLYPFDDTKIYGV